MDVTESPRDCEGEAEWVLRSGFDTILDWDYRSPSASLMKLYETGKRRQWNASERIDWSQDLDPENPMELPYEAIPLPGSEPWARMTAQERIAFRRHAQAWQLSQFLHGEQGALICSAKILQSAPHLDAKFYAATQVMDEARHVEAYSRLLHEKFELSYPVAPTLRRLLDDVISDSRWDMTYLGMQILLEGLALAAFAFIRDTAQNRLAAQVIAYVMQDEARHVAFGIKTLRDYYPQLSEKERDEREEFAVEACCQMRDRFVAEQVYERLGLPVEECKAYVEASPGMKAFRSRLFSRIVPAIKEIGLWGPRIRTAYDQMGVMEFAGGDLAALSAEDERMAQHFDATAFSPGRD